MACPTLMASSNYSSFDSNSSNNGRSQYHPAAVLDIGRSGIAVGKELKRQLTKYLNECRNRDDDHGSDNNATLKLKSSVKMKSPPPVPHPDYGGTGSITDGSEHSDEGWDTDFDDDMDEEKHKNEPQEETPATVANHTNGVQGPMMPKTTCQRSGPSSSINQSNVVCGDKDQTESKLPLSKKQMPRPPREPVMLPKNNIRPQRSIRPLQNPPPPPPRESPTIQSRDLDFLSDNYEVPTSALTDAGSTADRCGSSSRNSLSLSSRSTSPGKSEFLSQQDIEQEMLITDDELGMHKDVCDMSDDCPWPSSSSASSRSTPSDLPKLPPKNAACRDIPPPLPEKPRGKPAVPLSSKQSASSDDVTKKQKRTTKFGNGFLTLKNAARKITPEKKVNTGVKEKLDGSDHEFSPTQISHMTKSSSMSSLTRPLPPVPNGNERQNRASAFIPSLHSSPQLALPRGESENPLETQPWFHKVERDIAEALLKNVGHSGSYLVRESKRAGETSPYTLTIFYDDKISHLNIRKRSDGKFALGKEKGNEKPFNSVEELVLYHQHEPILLTARNQAIGKTILLQHPTKNAF